ncbi:hypothetical protein NP493_429g02056 [Ridgeia piscesae]|uniref:Uncharacterized protein n=1 Tax=Ridgeia piscesae TaxID=27915 RepID=A0AAD9NV79_RIDPI|nr:hypothetical protein NP493_429g02056 [Ridgeia piscesae]
MVKRLDARRPVSPDYFHAILQLYPEGAACHSSIFYHAPIIIARPHEIELADCYELCHGDSRYGRRKRLNPLNIFKSKIKVDADEKTQPAARGLSFPYAGTRTDSAWTRGVSSWTRSDAFRSTRSTCSVSALLVSPTQPLTIAGTAFRGRRRAFSLWKVLIYNLPYLPQLPGVSVCSC